MQKEESKVVMVQRLRRGFERPFFSDYRTLVGLWLLLPLAAALAKATKHNNYDIFRYVFWHTWEQTSLYVPSSAYFDTNHYGPLFSLIIAPFALMPAWIGMLCWLLALSMFLYYVIRLFPFTDRERIIIYWFCAHELLTALFMQQFNIAIAAIIIATFCCIEQEKDEWATFFIVVGTLVKLYGIVGLAFFFFSKHKWKFIITFVGWMIVLFALPMLLSSPHYIVGQYKEWIACLKVKNGENIFSMGQNISVLGMVRKISGSKAYSDWWLVGAGMSLFFLPLLRIKQYKYRAFRYTLLASVLLFTVLFSTGSESSTYIIPFIGVAIWYATVPWQRGKWDIFLMVFVFIVSSMSSSDLFPRFIKKELIQPYALKALPCAIVWLQLIYEMCKRNYAPDKTSH